MWRINMKRLLIGLTLLLTLSLVGCKESQTNKDIEEKRVVYQTLVEAEERSGLTNFNSRVIVENQNLNLPKTYNGVTFSYSSRNKDIISDEGDVVQPSTWWMQSRNQQGEVVEAFSELNKNWPIVIDVVMTYKDQERKAKILIIVAPHKDAVAPEYKG